MQLIAVITLVWLGMIVGISFLESWVKFQAPTLTKAVGVDVGRTVFGAFHKVQYGLIVILVIIGLFSPLLLWSWLILAALVIILALQGLWVLPNLSRRIDMILAGEKLFKSPIHFIYGILEIIKSGLLLYLALALMTIR
jgi:hypothetical protein